MEFLCVSGKRPSSQGSTQRAFTHWEDLCERMHSIGGEVQILLSQIALSGK